MALPAIMAAAGLIQGGIGIAQSIKQKREAEKYQKKEDAARQRRDSKIQQMETTAQMDATASQAPGAEIAQELGERNLATTYNNLVKSSASTAGTLQAASVMHQAQMKQAQGQQAANLQFRAGARRNLARVQGMGLQMQAPDVQDFSGRAQSLSYASDMNLANAFNAAGTGLTAAAYYAEQGDGDFFKNIFNRNQGGGASGTPNGSVATQLGTLPTQAQGITY